ncbi:MAG: hypothetical protein GY810_24790 [Aureispira sp.]|nr:hypothetical protein [Aureispira sp.]
MSRIKEKMSNPKREAQTHGIKDFFAGLGIILAQVLAIWLGLKLLYSILPMFVFGGAVLVSILLIKWVRRELV